jgi:hypothetical protein
VYSADGQRVLSASDDGTVKEWDRTTGKCLWTTPPFGGVFIAGCYFKGCRFSSREIEQLARVYGGNVINPTLRVIHAENPWGTQLLINISLGDSKPRNLFITGPNGSYKTRLLCDIQQAVDAILYSSKPGDVSVAFSDDNPVEPEQVLRLEHKAGYYQFLFFSAVHLYDEGRCGFWKRLDKMQQTIYQLKSDGAKEKADDHNKDLRKIEAMLSGLFATPILLEPHEADKALKVDEVLQVFHMINGIKRPLDRNKLPHGYSAALDIFGTMFTYWKDVTIPLNRLRGLVIIDELESHLHVSMQKKIFPWLTDLFPGVQFIVATHSPYILNSAKDVIVYDMEKCRELATSYVEQGLPGWTIDNVLDVILGVKSDLPDEVIDYLKDYDKARATGNILDVREKYEKLNAILSEGHPLRQVLRRQMIRFGGADE